MSFDSKNKDGLNSLHLSCSLFLLLTSGSRLIMNNSAKIQPIKFPKKSSSIKECCREWAYPLSVMLNIYIHNCVLSLYPQSIRQRGVVVC